MGMHITICVPQSIYSNSYINFSFINNRPYREFQYNKKEVRQYAGF